MRAKNALRHLAILRRTSALDLLAILDPDLLFALVRDTSRYSRHANDDRIRRRDAILCFRIFMSIDFYGKSDLEFVELREKNLLFDGCDG